MRALVSASDVTDVLGTHVDRVHDAARRLGCSDDEAYEVVRTAAGELVADLANRPESVGDVVGGLYARAREAVSRVRRGGGAPVPLDGGDSPLGDAEDVVATEEALSDLPERRRLGVLLVDSYALTLPQAAVALGLDVAETARTVALGRLALVESVDRDREVPSLSGHDVAVGDLGQLADGSAPVGGRFAALRKHVSGCATCAGVLGAETRGRGLVAALPVLGLHDDDRAELLTTVGERAAAVLPSSEQIRAELEGDVEDPPLIPWYVTTLAVVLALLLGIVVGKLFGGGSSGTAATPGRLVTETPTFATGSPVPSSSSAPASTSSSASTSRTTTSRTTATTSRPPTTSSTRPTTSAPAVPRITISPASGPNGQQIAVTGSGFPASSIVTITYTRQDGSYGDTESTTTNGAGTFTASVTANDPPGTSGTVIGSPVPHTGPHEVTARDGSAAATATFTQTS